MYARDNSWVRKIADFEPHLVFTEGEPSPYLGQSIIWSHCHHQSRIGRELRELHWTRKLMFPYKTWCVVHKPQGEARIAHQQLVRGTPRQGTYRLVIVIGAECTFKRPLK